MNEDEYKQLKGMIDRATEHEKKLSLHAHDADDPFTPVMRGIVDLLRTAKKRLSDRIDVNDGP
jgi:hypothetical protein